MASDSNPFASPAEVPVRTVRRRHPFRSEHSRASMAIACLSVVIVTRLYLAGLCALLTAQPSPGMNMSQAIQLGDVLDRLATVLSGVAFIAWFYRAYCNLRAMGNRGTDYSPGWTIGSWFIPLANLILPYLLMAEIVRGSIPRRADEPYPKTVPGLRLVLVWWALWIIMLILERWGLIVAQAGFDFFLVNTLWFAVIAYLVAFPAGIAAILVILMVDRNQEECNRIRRHEEVSVKPQADAALMAWLSGAQDAAPNPRSTN